MSDSGLVQIGLYFPIAGGHSEVVWVKENPKVGDIIEVSKKDNPKTVLSGVSLKVTRHEGPISPFAPDIPLYAVEKVK